MSDNQINLFPLSFNNLLSEAQESLTFARSLLSNVGNFRKRIIGSIE
ncbi:hypothetical protein CFPU101_11660 [Chroococcus sp. FPU101]|nr:hypothetical protein CFPU101_11660 [Chroococcus sp. FPU101]